jgi:hypothetical protein
VLDRCQGGVHAGVSRGAAALQFRCVSNLTIRGRRWLRRIRDILG